MPAGLIQEEEQQGTSAQAPDTVGSGDADGSIDWADLSGSQGEDDDQGTEAAADDSPTVEGADEIVEPAASESPAAPPATAAPAVPPPAAPVTSPVAQPAEPVAVAPQVAPQQSQPDPAAQAQDYAAWRANQLSALEKTYGLSQEDADLMLTEPEKVLPRVAAALHMQVTEHVMRSVAAMVPQMMQQTTQVNERETKARNEFFSVNDDLADPRFEAAIIQMGGMYRQLNPNTSPQDAIITIGNLVRQATGLPLRQAGVVPPAVAPAAPAATPTGFVPARGGSGGSGGRPAPSNNPFTAMAEDFLNEGF